MTAHRMKDAMQNAMTIDSPRLVRGLKGDDGFSLMELMVATFVTMVVLATTLGALNDGIRAADTAGLVAEMQHNSRTGLNMLTRDLMQAGQGIPIGGIPIPSGAGAVPINRPGPGVSMTFPTTWVQLPAVSSGQALGPDIQGRATDMITILYADATLPLNENPVATIMSDGSQMTIGSGPLTLAVAQAIEVGDLIMLSNAFGNAVQEVTDTNPGNQRVDFDPSDSMNLNLRTAPAGTIIQLQDSPGSFPPTTATRIWMITYYVDDSNPDSPRLMRVVNNTTPRPIALEIEDLQITYDLVDGVTNPSGVDEPTAPNSAAEIRKVNLMLASRSHNRQRVTGQYQRQSLTTQVSLRSLSFFDRYQ